MMATTIINSVKLNPRRLRMACNIRFLLLQSHLDAAVTSNLKCFLAEICSRNGGSGNDGIRVLAHLSVILQLLSLQIGRIPKAHFTKSFD